MAFLDEQSRAVLFEPPEAYEDAQARYALTSEDIVFVKEHRRSHNRLGFAIQLALVRDLGRLASRHEGGESVRLLRTYPEFRLV